MEDECAVDASGVPPKNDLILAMVRYQSLLTSSSFAIAVSAQHNN